MENNVKETKRNLIKQYQSALVYMANITDPGVQKAVKDYCTEMSNSMLRAEAERDFQKEATKNIAETHELDKKILTKLAKTYHKSNFATICSDQEQFETAYEALFGKTE